MQTPLLTYLRDIVIERTYHVFIHKETQGTSWNLHQKRIETSSSPEAHKAELYDTKFQKKVHNKFYKKKNATLFDNFGSFSKVE